MSRTSAMLGNMAKSLTPKPKDARRFRTAKAMTFSVDEARKLALAFHMTKQVSKKDDLSFVEFIVTMAEVGLGVAKMNETDVEVAETTMKEIFAVVGSGARTIVLD